MIDRDEGVDTLCRTIVGERCAGTTSCWIFRDGRTVDRADLLRTQGLQDLASEHWVRVSRGQAERILTQCLHVDMAYGCELMSRQRALSLARSLLMAARADTYLTNGNPYGVDLGPQHAARSWSPISRATFDTGVIATLQGEVSAILWIQDED